MYGNATRGRRLKSEDRIKGTLPFVTAGETKEGISDYIGNSVTVFKKNTITIDMFGSAKFRNYQYGADDHIAVVHTDDLSSYAACFVTSAIHKVSKTGEFHYGRNLYAKDADNLHIMLPARNGKPNYTFMEAYVANIELNRITQLDHYLQRTGLKNYLLSAQENEVINKFDQFHWKAFSYSTLFNHIQQGKRLKKSDQLPGDIPFVMAGTTNTGVVNYISNPVRMFPANAITVDIFGNVFYRNYEFGAGDDTGVYWNEGEQYSEKVMIFLASAVECSVKGKFSFGNKLRSSQSLNFQVVLPENDGKPDFKVMELLISAVQKTTVKDVVQYTARRIEATKQIINNEKENPV